MLLYLCICSPFVERNSNTINIFNEVVLLLTFSWILAINYFSNLSILTDEVLMISGWILIGFIGFSLVLTWYFLFPSAVKELISVLGNCINKKQTDSTDIKSKIVKTKKTAK